MPHRVLERARLRLEGGKFVDGLGPSPDRPVAEPLDHHRRVRSEVNGSARVRDDVGGINQLPSKTSSREHRGGDRAGDYRPRPLGVREFELRLLAKGFQHFGAFPLLPHRFGVRDNGEA